MSRAGQEMPLSMVVSGDIASGLGYMLGLWLLPVLVCLLIRLLTYPWLPQRPWTNGLFTGVSFFSAVMLMSNLYVLTH